MSPHVPDPWVALVLALAGFRMARLLGWDHVTLPLRRRFRRYRTVTEYGGGEGKAFFGPLPAPGARTVGWDAHPPPEAPWRAFEWETPWHRHVSALLACYWCLGWWLSAAWWLAYSASPRWTAWAAVPWALSGAVGLVARWLDP